MSRKTVYNYIISVCFAICFIMVLFPWWYLDISTVADNLDCDISKSAAKEATASIDFKISGHDLIFGTGTIEKIENGTYDFSDISDAVYDAGGGFFNSLTLDSFFEEAYGDADSQHSLYLIVFYAFPLVGFICSLVLKPNKKRYYIAAIILIVLGGGLLLFYDLAMVYVAFSSTIFMKIGILCYLVNIVAAVLGMVKRNKTTVSASEHTAQNFTLHKTVSPVPQTAENVYSPQTTYPVQQTVTKIFCPECGTENDANSKFCENCGTKLED